MKKPQVILGIDPGLRHTGYCVLVDGKPREHGVIRLEGHGKVAIADALRCMVGGLCPVLSRCGPLDAAAVEQVGWYGSRKAITLPLSHTAGCLVGFLLACDVPVYLLLANQRKPVAVKRPRAGWEEHDLDALELAIVAKAHLDAVAAGEGSIPRALSAVDRRRITVEKPAHG